MTNTQQQALADRIQKELDCSTINSGIPYDLLAELFEWKKDNNISIEALKNLEDILKNYF